MPVVVLKNFELFDMCVKESCFPDCWKVSSVVPVFRTFFICDLAAPQPTLAYSQEDSPSNSM